MKTILQNLNYAAPYPGNLMRSIWALEKKCDVNYNIIYLFPESANRLYWVNEMIARGCKVYFKTDDKSNFTDVILQIINECDVNIIHTHFYSPVEYKLMHKIERIASGDVKLVLHHHNHFMDTKSIKYKSSLVCFVKRIYMMFRKSQIKSVIDTGVNIACSTDVEKNLKKNKFKKVICVENAIDFTRLNLVSNLKRNDMGLSEDDNILLMFGFAFFRKGVDLALKAIEPIADNYKIKLCIVFSANKEQGVNNIHEVLGYIPEWVKILPPNDDIANYYNISNIFLSPSREEGFCYSMVESVYCGCYLIASNISGQKHAKDFPYKKIVNVGSKEEIRDAIIGIINKPLTKSQIEENRSYVHKRYSLDNWCDKIISVYDSLT